MGQKRNRVVWRPEERNDFYLLALHHFKSPGLTGAEITKRAMLDMPAPRRRSITSQVIAETMKWVRENRNKVEAIKPPEPTKETTQVVPVAESAATEADEMFDEPTLSEMILHSAVMWGAHFLGDLLSHEYVKEKARELALAFLGHEKQAAVGPFADFLANRPVKGAKVLIVGLDPSHAENVRREFGDRCTLVFMHHEHINSNRLRTLAARADMTLAYAHRGEHRVRQIIESRCKRHFFLFKGSTATLKGQLDKMLKEWEAIQPQAKAIKQG